MSILKRYNGTSWEDLSSFNSTIVSTVTLNLLSWDDNQQTVSVPCLSANNHVVITPAPASFNTYTECGIYCSSQSNESLTFVCSIVPSVSLTVNVMIFDMPVIVRNPFAMVLINYSQGSTFTQATNVTSYVDISSTQRLYYVEEPSSGSTQECEFEITDGTQTVTKTVDNITIGTSRTILLEYLHYLYHRGDECTELTGGWIAGPAYAGTSWVDKGTESIRLYTNVSPNIESLLTNNTIDTTGYTQLCATIKCNNGGYARMAFVPNKTDWGATASAELELNTTYTEETTVRLSFTSGINQYIQFRAGNGLDAYIEIFDVWLE